jgi:hypothetical protein
MAARSRNPVRSRDEAIELFKETIRQPELESVAVAQDILIEAGITLAEASLEAGVLDPPIWSTEHHADAAGFFWLAGAQGEPEEVGVSWRARGDRGNFTIDVNVMFDEVAFDTFEEHRGRPVFSWRDSAIFEAVKEAWRIVKIIKHIGLHRTSDQLIDAIHGVGLAANKSVTWPDNDPVTPPSVVSKYGKAEEERLRKNPTPQAVTKYRQFHQHDPRKIVTYKDVSIPTTAFCVGKAEHVLYRSDKLNPGTGEDEGWIDYIHEHDSGVHVYRCDRDAAQLGEECTVPEWIRGRNGRTDLTWLGECLGFAYKDGDGKKIEAKGTRPLPELYCTPSGKALVVIQGKRRVLAIIWGGRLGVEPRGIVH